MTGVDEFIVLKGERLSRSKVCDCIVFYGRKPYGVALVELKSSYSHAGPIVEKFTNTLKIVADLSEKTGLSLESQYLVLLSKNHRNAITSDLLNEVRITFSGVKRRIHLNKCGDCLLSIIGSEKLARH